MAFRCVFVPGVNEGLFPRPPAEDPLLLQAQRAVARRRTARRGYRTAAHRRRLRVGAVHALLFAPGSVDRARTRAFLLRLRGPSRGRRAGDRRARIRGARPLRHAHAHRLAGAARPRRRHRRRGIRSRHPGPAGQGFGRVSEESAGPRRGVPARALDALAQAVEAGRRPVRRRDRQRCAQALPAHRARLVALGVAAVRPLSLPFRAARHLRPAPRGSARRASSAWTRRSAAISITPCSSNCCAI